MDIAQLTAFFGWMLVINIAIYAFSAAFIVFARDLVTTLQVRVTRVPAEEWPRLLMDYLSRYKLLVIVFNLVPYLALRLVG